jgi:hypothetical protein
MLSVNGMVSPAAKRRQSVEIAMPSASADRFPPKFPVYIPCRGNEEKSEPLVYDNGTSKAVLLFTDRNRCRVFGAQYGHSDYLVVATPGALASRLLEASRGGLDMVWLDPQGPEPIECVIPIAHAIFGLAKMPDRADDNEE